MSRSVCVFSTREDSYHTHNRSKVTIDKSYYIVLRTAVLPFLPRSIVILPKWRERILAEYSHKKKNVKNRVYDEKERLGSSRKLNLRPSRRTEARVTFGQFTSGVRCFCPITTITIVRRVSFSRTSSPQND